MSHDNFLMLQPIFVNLGKRDHVFTIQSLTAVSYTHLLNNIPLDETDYKDELNTIKYLAESNGYDRTIVSKLLHKTNIRQRQKTTNS